MDRKAQIPHRGKQILSAAPHLTPVPPNNPTRDCRWRQNHMPCLICQHWPKQIHQNWSNQNHGPYQPLRNHIPLVRLTNLSTDHRNTCRTNTFRINSRDHTTTPPGVNSIPVHTTQNIDWARRWRLCHNLKEPARDHARKPSNDIFKEVGKKKTTNLSWIFSAEAMRAN